MKWIYDSDGNADLEEVAFAEKGISAILENVDLSSAPSDAADAAMCLLGRLVVFSQVKVDSSLCRFPTLRSGHARTPSFRYQRA